MSRFNFRQRPKISYYEPEETNLDEYIFCERCSDYVYEYCSIHGPLLVVPDDRVKENPNVPSFVPRAALTIPKIFLHLAPSVIPGAGLGVFTTLTIPRNVRFGPYKGEKTTEINSMYCWQIYDSNNKPSYAIDAADANKSNWMRYVNCARHWREQNLVAFQYQGQLYYRTIKIIPEFTELMVFYGSEFANSLQVNLRKYNSPSEYAQKFGAPILKKPRIDSRKEKTDSEPLNEQHINSNANIKYISDINEVIEIINLKSNCTEVLVEDKNNYTHETFKDKFICDDCGLTFDKKDSIKWHLKTKHVKDLFFRCIKCVYFTVAKETLEKHSKMHDKQRQHVCKLCNYRFKTSSHLRGHTRSCSQKNCISNTETVKIYPCSECNKQFITNNNLQRHLRIHTAEKPYACLQCDRRFNTNSVLMRHGKIHIGEKLYQCAECDKRFIQKSDLSKHVMIHTGEKPFQCAECDKKFSQNYKLTIHTRTHTGEKPYQCAECDKKFSQNNMLKIHTRTHTGEKPFQCAECDKKFSQNYKLKIHTRTHTGEKPYQCAECDKKFSQNNMLKIHTRTHTGEKPFQCAECDKKFSQNYKLKIHTRTHTGEKPYQCAECDKKFSQNNMLKIHTRTHTGEKPYQCAECDKVFRHRSTLKRHINTHEKTF